MPARKPAKKPAKKAARKPAAKKATKAAKKAPARKPAKKAAKKPAAKAAKRPAKKPVRKTAARKPAGLAPGVVTPANPPPVLRALSDRDETVELDADEMRAKAARADEAFRLNKAGDDDIAEELGEDFLRSATGGEEPAEEHDKEQEEERGGPFIETGASQELASGTDASNPEDAEPEAFPTANAEESDAEDEENDESE